MRRIAISLGLVGALLLATTLSVAPNLHELIHADASAAQHECLVTLISHGGCDHAPAGLVCHAPVVSDFSRLRQLNPIWVPAVFADARIFEHAPPQYS